MQRPQSLVPEVLYPGYCHKYTECAPQQVKSLIHLLDPNTCKFPEVIPCDELGTLHSILKLLPSNFKQLSYLNIDTCWYSRSVEVFRGTNWTWQLQTFWLKRHFFHGVKEEIFSAFEKAMFHRMKHSSLSPFLGKYLKVCKIIKRCRNATEARRIYYALAEVIIQKECSDSKLVVNFLETVCESLGAKMYFFLGHNNAFYLDYLIFKAQESKFNFWGILNYDDSNRFPLCPILGSLFSGKENHMKVLLSYGFQRISPIYLNLHSTGFQSPIYLAYNVSETLKRYGIDVQFPRIQGTEGNMNRIFLVIEMVYVLCLTKMHDKKSFATCMKLLWRAMPDHCISFEEIVYVLAAVADGDLENTLKTLYENQKQLFEDIIVSSSKPRSLQHLSRCAIRKCLKQNFVLPLGISGLSLPESIKTYLKLEE